ncbi:unnamed protein product, partial [Coregonus sp. 'balchen']
KVSASNVVKLSNKLKAILKKKGFHFNSILKELDISRNHLGDSVDWADVLFCLFSLETLSLRCCGITAEGCSSLALALKSSHSSITELGLMGNDTGEDGLRILSAIRDDPRYKLQTLE